MCYNNGMKMMRHFRIAALMVWAAGGVVPAHGEELRVLARVELEPGAPALAVPAYERLVDGAGREYVLAVATPKELAASGAAYVVLDEGGAPEEFVIAVPRTARARLAVKNAAGTLYDDGRQVVVRADTAGADALAAQGCAVVRLSRMPLDPRTVRAVEPGGAKELLAVPRGFAPSQLVAAMIAAIQPVAVSAEVARLSGEQPVMISGTNYTILTRHTGSGEPLNKATQYVYERFAALGLAPQYHSWTNGSWINRNVIGTQPGSTRSNEVVLVVAHLDNMPSGPRAPGADDNASGCVGVLAIAEQLAAHTWPRTILYVCFTGEEQGLYGSAAYADLLAARGENVVAVFNMDMIAWDADLNPRLRLHTRTSGTADHVTDLAIAHIFTNAVGAYGLQGVLSPIFALSGIIYSDHSRFWNRGYPAILAIEDDSSDFNAYYHTTNDTLAALNIPYFTAYVKASLGAVAHLALGPPLPAHAHDGVVLLEEGFDTPGVPAGWSAQVLVNNGTDGAGPLGGMITVTNVARSAHPPSFVPHGGARFARFNARNVYAGGRLRLACSTPFSTLNTPAAKVLFAWARDNEYAGSFDEMVVEWSTNGTAWAPVTNVLRFCADAECWFEETCWLPPAALGQPAVYLALQFTSQYGNDCHVDSLAVRAVPEPGLMSALCLVALMCRRNRTYRTNRTYDDGC